MLIAQGLLTSLKGSWPGGWLLKGPLANGLFHGLPVPGGVLVPQTFELQCHACNVAAQHLSCAAAMAAKVALLLGELGATLQKTERLPLPRKQAAYFSMFPILCWQRLNNNAMAPVVVELPADRPCTYRLGHIACFLPSFLPSFLEGSGGQKVLGSWTVLISIGA